MIFRRTVLTGLFLLIAAPAVTAAAAIPRTPVRIVTDQASLLSPPVIDELENRLAEFERRSGIQFIVYIARSLEGEALEDWTVRAFAAWGIGQRGADNGLALFLFSEERRLRIEVGYGLEGRIPDALAGRIIRDVMAPALQRGDADGAVRAGVEALMTAALGEPLGETAAGERPEERPEKRTSPLQVLVFIILGIGFLILFITNPSLALYLLFSILSGGRGGGGGGGGFRGGGGRSGGGGASGSW